MKRTRFIFTCLLALLTVLTVIALASCEADEELETAIKSVKVDGKGQTVVVEATLDAEYAENHSKDKLYILGLPTTDPDGSLDGAIVMAEGRARKKMNFKFDLLDKELSRLTYGFVLAEKNGDNYAAISDVSYISNPEVLASGAKGNNETSGIKGMESLDVVDAQLVGAEHILFEVRIDYMIADGYKNDPTVFNYCGNTYYFNTWYIEYLEKMIEDADKVGMKVYLKTVLGESEDAEGELRLSFLYCDGANRGANGYLPNLADPDAARYLNAFYAFIAERYPVSDFIIGDSVNNYDDNCNAGDLEAEQVQRLYFDWARKAYLTLASVNSDARIYLPIDHAWRKEAEDGYIGSKVFISHFAANAKKSGDYPYSISLDLGTGEDLPSLLSGKEYDYASIGVNNLSDLPDLLDKAEFRYKGERRDVIIGSLELSNEITEANRAAYYTFAYYTAAQNGYSAFITSSPLYSEGVTRSDYYYAMLMCGSDMTSQLKGYTDKLVNVHVPDFKNYKTLDLTYSQSPSLEVSESVTKNKKEFPRTYDEFTLRGTAYNSCGSTSVDNDGEQERSWVIEADTTYMSGALTTLSVPAKDIISSAYIGINMSSDTAAKLSLVISNESGTSTYIGEAKLANAATTYYFNISDFAKEIDSSDILSVSVCIVAEGEGKESVEIKEIALFGATSKGGDTIIVIVVVVIILAAMGGLIAFLAVSRKNKSKAKKSPQKDDDEE